MPALDRHSRIHLKRNKGSTDKTQSICIRPKRTLRGMLSKWSFRNDHDSNYSPTKKVPLHRTHKLSLLPEALLLVGERSTQKSSKTKPSRKSNNSRNPPPRSTTLYPGPETPSVEFTSPLSLSQSDTGVSRTIEFALTHTFNLSSGGMADSDSVKETHVPIPPLSAENSHCRQDIPVGGSFEGNIGKEISTHDCEETHVINSRWLVVSMSTPHSTDSCENSLDYEKEWCVVQN
jgi:hypothetical protein